MTSINEIRKAQIYFIFIFLMLAVIIGGGGHLYLDREIKNIRAIQQDELSAIAELKLGQLINWRTERLGNAETIYHNTPLIRSIEQLLKGGAEEAGLKKDILVWMRTVQQHYHYEDIFLLDPVGQKILSLTQSDKKACALPYALITEAQRSGQIVMSDLYQCEDGTIIVDTIIPLVGPGENNNETIGAIILRVDPDQFLYPLIQSWPTPSRTSETLLVRREGEYVVFLNELRHRKNTAFSLRIPISRQEIPAVMALAGKEGIVEGRDYRGVPVLAVIKKVPDSPWFLIAKVDKDELYAPARNEAVFVTSMIFLLLLISLASLGLFWQLRISKFYRAQYEIENQRAGMEEKLKEANEDWERTFNSTSDLIFILSADNTIMKVNKALADFLKVSPKGIIGRKCYEVVHKLTNPWPGCPLEEVKIDKKPHTSEVNDEKAGLSFLVSVSPIFNDKGELAGIVHVAKDITGLKNAEGELKKKINDLERFQKITLDRELKMKELKAEMERLKGGIKK